MRARFASATTDGMEPGWAQNGRRRLREGLSLPFSATRVSPTFRSVTPRAAGGARVGEGRGRENQVTFDAEVKSRNLPFWQKKDSLPGSGHFNAEVNL